MKRVRIATALLFALCALALTACGDDLDDKSLGEVSDEEAKTLCEEQSDYADSKLGSGDAQRGNCVLSEGLIAGDMCAEATQTCVDNGGAETLFGGDCSEATAEGAPDCDATVGEARACTEALVDQYAAYVATVTCDDAGTPPQTQPQSCIDYFEKCPEAAPNAS